MGGAGVICQKKKSVHLVAVWCLRSFSTLCISVSNWTWNCLSSSFLFFQKGAVSLFHFPILETKRIRTIAEDETNVPWKESHRTIDDDKKNRSSDWQQMCVMVLKPGISGAFLQTKKAKMRWESAFVDNTGSRKWAYGNLDKKILRQTQIFSKVNTEN